MAEGRQLTKTSKAGPSLPSNASQRTAEPAQRIAAILNRLALHCPIRSLPERQAAMVMEDMIRDLLGFDAGQVAQACDDWRRGPTPFFPTSGQLIALMESSAARSIANRRANAPVHRAPKMIEGPRGPLKPWRQILAEHKKLPITP